MNNAPTDASDPSGMQPGQNEQNQGNNQKKQPSADEVVELLRKEYAPIDGITASIKVVVPKENSALAKKILDKSQAKNVFEAAKELEKLVRGKGIIELSRSKAEEASSVAKLLGGKDQLKLTMKGDLKELATKDYAELRSFYQFTPDWASNWTLESQAAHGIGQNKSAASIQITGDVFGFTTQAKTGAYEGMGGFGVFKVKNEGSFFAAAFQSGEGNRPTAFELTQFVFQNKNFNASLITGIGQGGNQSKFVAGGSLNFFGITVMGGLGQSPFTNPALRAVFDEQLSPVNDLNFDVKPSSRIPIWGGIRFDF